MKKLIQFICVTFLLLVTLSSFSQAISFKLLGCDVGLDNMVAATFFDVKNQDILYGGITSLVDYKNIIAIDGGYVTDMKNGVPCAGIGLNIGKLATICGLNVNPILKNCQLGSYYGNNFEKDNQIEIYGLYLGINYLFEKE